MKRQMVAKRAQNATAIALGHCFAGTAMNMYVHAIARSNRIPPREPMITPASTWNQRRGRTETNKCFSQSIFNGLER